MQNRDFFNIKINTKLRQASFTFNGNNVTVQDPKKLVYNDMRQCNNTFDDCSRIAMSLAFGLDYKEAHHLLNEEAEKIDQTSNMSITIHNVLTKNGFKASKMRIPTPVCKLSTFITNNCKDSLLCTYHHIFYVKDGIIYDNILPWNTNDPKNNEDHLFWYLSEIFIPETVVMAYHRR